MYNALILTTMLYALFQIYKIFKDDGLIINNMETKNILVLFVWTCYIIGSTKYVVSDYLGIHQNLIGF